MHPFSNLPGQLILAGIIVVAFAAATGGVYAVMHINNWLVDRRRSKG